MNSQEADVIFIRHAESQFNQASYNAKQKIKSYDWEVLRHYQEFTKGVKYNPRLIDCSITQKGRNQCIARAPKYKNFQADIILVSPLERALQTCSLLFQQSKIPVIVQPMLAELFTSSCDLGSEIQGKVKRFPHYNFEKVVKLGDFWYLHNQSAQNKQKYMEALKEQKLETHRDKTEAILSYMQKTLICQPPKNLRQRSSKIRHLLKEYKNRYNKIIVVGHYNTISYTICRQFDQNHKPISTQLIQNCEPVFDNINNLLLSK